MVLIKKFFPILFILFVSVFALLPLLHSGFYPMHDDEQIARLFDLDQSLKAGHFPPRIIPNLGFGYGYPFFNFYPPFAYHVGELYHLMGFGFIVSTKLMLTTGFLLSALFMFLLAKEFFGKVGGLVSSTAYVYASYRAVDVYVRGAYAEFFAFVPLPLIFLSIYKISQKNEWFVIFNSFAVAGLILSHNLIAFMSAPFIGIWMLYCLYIATDKKKFIVRTFLSSVLGLGLSAYFFLPSYFEKGYTLVNILTQELANYSLHFVCVHQLWDSPWGYGGSILGCYDGISFEIGKLSLILSFVSIILATIYFKKKARETFPILLFGFFLVISIFLMTKYSRPVWDLIPPLWYIQFPWRYLLFASFFTSILSGAIFIFFKNDTFKMVLAIALISLLVLSTQARFTPVRYFNADDKFYTNFNKIRWETSSLAYEYVPNGISLKKSKIGTTLVNIEKNEIASSSSLVVSGQMEIITQVNLPHKKKFDVNVSSPGVFQINTYSFPGWEVRVDGKTASYSDQNKLKLIRVNLDQGKHTVDADFNDTKVRFAGNTISVTSIILLIALSISYGKRHKKT